LPVDLKALFENAPQKLVLFEQMLGADIDSRFRPLFQESKIVRGGEKAVYITRDKILEDRRSGDGVGRYVIWLKDGKLSYSWESEGDMQALFRQAGLKLESENFWSQPKSKYLTDPPKFPEPKSTISQAPASAENRLQPGEFVSAEVKNAVKEDGLAPVSSQPASERPALEKHWLVWIGTVIGLLFVAGLLLLCRRGK
jgi:hypothetical protein